MCGTVWNLISQSHTGVCSKAEKYSTKQYLMPDCPAHHRKERGYLSRPQDYCISLKGWQFPQRNFLLNGATTSTWAFAYWRVAPLDGVRVSFIQSSLVSLPQPPPDSAPHPGHGSRNRKWGEVFMLEHLQDTAWGGCGKLKPVRTSWWVGKESLKPSVPGNPLHSA